MDLEICWSEPFKVKVGAIDKWRRIWHIPEDMRGAFFEVWKEIKFDLLKEGFRVYKEEDEWYLSETVISKYAFKEIGNTKRTLQIPEMSNFILSDYDIKNENGLRPWQVVAAGRLVSAINTWGAAMDGSDLGVGKTYTACAAVRDMGMKFVVVCPRAVITSWKKVIHDHFKMQDQIIGIINYEQLRIGKKSSDLASFVISRETRRKTFTWKVPKNTLIVWDEAQKLKNWKTKTAKTCISAFKQGYRQLFCSATNATNPLELRTVGVCMKLFKNGETAWYEWLKLHGCYKGTWGMEFTENKDLQKKVLKKLNKDIFIDRGVRLRRDAIPNFPKCDLFAVLLDMDKENQSKINAIYDEMDLELRKLEQLKKLNKHNHLVVELRYRQQIELVKVPLFIDMIEDAKKEGFSVVLFVNFTETIKAIASRINTTCIFDGTVENAQRERNKDRFQNNEEQVILVSIKAGGSGLSLHDLNGGHPRLALISPSYSAPDMRQCLGRVWRDDAKTKAIQKLVCVSGTVEEKVYKSVMDKLTNLDLLNDGDLSYSRNFQYV